MARVLPPPRVAILFAAWLLAAAPAPPTQQQLQDAERARAAQQQAAQAAAERAAAARAETARLADLRQAALARLRGAEAATEAEATRMADLVAQQRAAEAALAARTAEMAPLLPVIQRLTLFPTETLLAAPLPPEDTVRGVLVLGGVVREIQRAAQALRVEHDRLAATKAEIDAESGRLADAQAAQATQAASLDDQLRQAQEARRAADDAAAEAARRVAAEAARADSLRAAIARLEAEAARIEAARLEAARREADRIEAARLDAARRSGDTKSLHEAASRVPLPSAPVSSGPYTIPVAGRVVRGFGDPADAGTATGISYQAAPAARVSAPCGGRVVFAAPFRSYGLLLIVDCGGGTHFVLAGFDRLDVQVGQSVPAGEPVGVMPGWDPRSSGPRPSLYVELRRRGDPVNPAPLMRGGARGG